MNAADGRCGVGDRPPDRRGVRVRASWLSAAAATGFALSGASGCGSQAPPAVRVAPVAAPAASPAAPAPIAAATGSELYGRYCLACHGEAGGGDGPAARYLYPKPRDFRQGRFRLVTTTNQAPSDDDLMRVLERGMPGSSMFPFAHLPEVERKALVAEVRSKVARGLEDRIRQEAKEFGEEFDPKEFAEALAARTHPGPRLESPSDFPPTGSESVARGAALYRKSCASCHGETGKGDGVQAQQDESGMPIRPRDFTRGVFKGGRDRDQLYARIMLGVPGTPMPSSSSTFTPAEAGDVVNFILSLSSAATADRVEHHRRRVFAWWMTQPFPDDAVPEPVWARTEPTSIVASPLWWRDHGDPDLEVRAAHDRETLAIRLSWRDPTVDSAAIRTQDFPDMAAVQLFKGKREPFLGMGAAGEPVDVWLWNAAAQADLKEYADVDTAHPDMAVDQYPFETPSDGPRAHPTDHQAKGFVTAWDAGNPRSDPTRVAAGGSLHAQGFGSLTMRPKVSQAVRAQGRREGDRWVVVLRRPLKSAVEDGLSLAPGERVSIAFAIWDGAARDRNGQKLVTIWHDLVLE